MATAVRSSNARRSSRGSKVSASSARRMSASVSYIAETRLGSGSREAHTGPPQPGERLAYDVRRCDERNAEESFSAGTKGIAGRDDDVGDVDQVARPSLRVESAGHGQPNEHRRRRRRRVPAERAEFLDHDVAPLLIAARDWTRKLGRMRERVGGALLHRRRRAVA